MHGIEEIRSTLYRATDEAAEAQIVLAQAGQTLETVRAALVEVALTSQRDEIQQSLACFGDALTGLDSVTSSLSVAVDQARSYATSL